MHSRLSILYFLQFAVWGCYLSCFGQLLGAGGIGADIQWFYAAVGLVSLITPALMGHLSDRFVPSLRLLGTCHLFAALFMMGAWLYTSTCTEFSFWPIFLIYVGFLAFYMPTMALSNTTTFALLKRKGLQPVDVFPVIRIWGTIGFVAAMWFVNSAYIYNGEFGFTLNDLNPAATYRFQYTPMQLFSSSILGLLTALYTLSLPATEVPDPGKSSSLGDIFGFKAFKMFKLKDVRVFLIFAIFTGVCLQISNGYAVPFINHFMGIEEFAGSLAAGNATMLFSLSQISEAAFILITGIAMKRIGFKTVITIALVAWCLRFLFLGIGNPGPGLVWLILSMVVYGISFNFFNIAGHIYMDQRSDHTTRGFGQGLLMMMSNGIGATGGMIAAGAIINHYCRWDMVPIGETGNSIRLFMGDWEAPWLIFAAYSLLIAILFYLFFRRKTIHQTER
ncbi:MAG: MFS transporter [Muribaculaceae bacterium]|nr:MFS transporter [Muribaculaceae bacterium]